MKKLLVFIFILTVNVISIAQNEGEYLFTRIDKNLIKLDSNEDLKLQNAAGRVIMPSHPNLKGEGFDEIYNGTYIVKNDSLQFKGTDNALSHPQLYFIIKERKLEANLFAHSPLKIILERIK
jgi:hypothetical protein